MLVLSFKGYGRTSTNRATGCSRYRPLFVLRSCEPQSLGFGQSWQQHSCSLFCALDGRHVFDHGAHIDLILGRWGDGTTAHDRYAVSLEYRIIDGGPQLMVIDSQHRDVAKSDLVGQGLESNRRDRRPARRGCICGLRCGADEGCASGRSVGQADGKLGLQDGRWRRSSQADSSHPVNCRYNTAR